MGRPQGAVDQHHRRPAETVRDTPADVTLGASRKGERAGRRAQDKRQSRPDAIHVLLLSAHPAFQANPLGAQCSTLTVGTGCCGGIRSGAQILGANYGRRRDIGGFPRTLPRVAR
jgi:hypothetical protein